MMTRLNRHSKYITRMQLLAWVATLLSISAISGCAIEPTSIIAEPKTAKPTAVNSSENNNGAIYNAKTYRAILADRRPQFVGDIVTIRIAENTSAKKSGTNSITSANSNETSISLFPKADFSANADRSYDNAANSAMSNAFNGLITATVVEVLPNGYLVIRGEKQVAFDKGTEFVRVSGIVNPDNITQGNNVASTSMSDAKIEYRTSSKVDAAEIASKFARFFLSMGF